MKRTPLRKQSKSSMSKLQRDLWKECRRVADIFYPPERGLKTRCYTCGKQIEGRNKQLGHVPWAKASLGANLKYDMRVLRWQCYHCNINLGGQGAEAYKRMLREEGKAYMERLEKERQKTVKARDHYEELLAYYKSLEA